jgi:glycosyltransferase involved in cell wall biosynthesis/acylphosphatase
VIGIIIFTICTALLVYVFVVYPILVLILGSSRKREFTLRWEEPPTVTMILSAHNEAETIAQKLENALMQDYPEEKLDIIVVDDGSTDDTAEIVHNLESNRITLVQQEAKRGKTSALNRAVEEADAEVLVFTDANAMYKPDAVSRLVEMFDAEGQISVVCGELHYQQHPQAISDEESRYWSFEIRLKKAESNLGTLLGANGSIYAMRRELYEPLREDLISDFIGPLLLSMRGYRTVYQPQAISVETSTRSLKSEFRRKKRIVQRGLFGLSVHRELLNPFKTGWLAVKLWSHKVLRWLTLLWLLGMLIGNWGMDPNTLFQILVYYTISVLRGGSDRNFDPIGRHAPRYLTASRIHHDDTGSGSFRNLGGCHRKESRNLGTPEMNDVCAHLIVKGRVQGVGFRFFALSWAERLGLTGWVRNSYDGSVETEVEGDRSAVEDYIEQMKVGPRWSQVTDVQVEYKPYEGIHPRFDVTR